MDNRRREAQQSPKQNKQAGISVNHHEKTPTDELRPTDAFYPLVLIHPLEQSF